MENSKVKRNRMKKQISEMILPKTKATKLKKEILSVRQRLKLLFGEAQNNRKTTQRTSEKQTMQRASSLSQLLYPLKKIPDVKATERIETNKPGATDLERQPTTIQEIWLNRPEDVYSGSNCSVAFFSICNDPDETLTDQSQKRFCGDFTNWDLELDSNTVLGSRQETYGSEESNSDSSIGEHSKDSAMETNRRKTKSTSALLGKRTLTAMREPLQFCTYRSPVKKKAVRRKLQTFSKQVGGRDMRDVKTLAIV